MSLGQTPDLSILQESLHFQLCGEPFPSKIASLPDSLVAEQRLAALKSAALHRNVLLVLDDVWDGAHLPMFNCLDRDTTSCTLVTSRQRGLFADNTVEVCSFQF
jgi:hypothetical protein